MYHVISTSSIAIILYLISYFFYRIGYLTLQQHSKIWNTLLAAAFFSTALAGVFLALQINYKWNIPEIKSILRWHVEFGIGMTITGLIHFLWHLNYYGKLFTKSIIEVDKQSFPELSSKKISINLFITGLVSSSIQFLMLREMMNITGGYELISGSFLGSWLISSAIGSYLAGKSKLTDIKKINLVFSLSPLISLLLMLLLSRVYLNPGETPSLLAALIYTFIVLLPFCMVSGFTFIKLIDIGAENEILPGNSFSAETLGGIAAGLLISFLTAGLLNTYKILLLIILLSFGYFLLSFQLKIRKHKLAGILIISAAAIAVLVSDPDLFFRRLLQPSMAVISTQDSPYGNITRGKYKGEESLYYNQKLLSYNDNATEREEDIHYAMLQKETPQSVIMISGSLNSHLPEILKYPVKSIIFIERDPYLSKYEHTPGNPALVHIINTDVFNYMRKSKASADVIILLTPPPSTLLLNRFYTLEFFSAVKKRLAKDGVFMCSPGQGDNYYNKESMDLYSSIYNSLAANFRNVEPVVGNKLYFLASDNPLSLSFCELVEKRHIQNIYVGPDYLEDTLIIRKSQEVRALINRRMKLNRASFPIATLHSQSYQLSKNRAEKIPAILLMFMVFVLPVFTIRRRDNIMYFSASALAGFELILLLTLQITIGNMYQLTGMIIAGLMAGLAAGSGLKISSLDTILLRNKVIFLLFFYIFFGMIYNFLIVPKNAIISVLEIMFAGFLPAFFTGHIFRQLTMRPEGIPTSSSIYSADLAGSALGFVIISGVAIPLIGIRASIFMLAALIFAGLLFGSMRKIK